MVASHVSPMSSMTVGSTRGGTDPYYETLNSALTGRRVKGEPMYLTTNQWFTKKYFMEECNDKNQTIKADALCTIAM